LNTINEKNEDNNEIKEEKNIYNGIQKNQIE
jgi:hypothetical protein